MPRVRPLGVTKQDKQNRPVEMALSLLRGMGKVTVRQLCNELRIGGTTFYERLKHPENFTLWEIRQLNRMLESQGLPTIEEGVLK